MSKHKDKHGADRVIAIAKDELGYKEGSTRGVPNNFQKYSPAVPGLEWSQSQPWCATFVSWVALQAGYADLFPRTASCDAGGNWFKQRGQWSEYPKLGAQVFFGTPNDLSHTGIVVAFDDTYVWSVEGNTNTTGSRNGDGVYINKRRRRASNVIGYGYPKYPAAPKAKPAPKPKAKQHPNVDAYLAAKTDAQRIAALRKVSDPTAKKHAQAWLKAHETQQAALAAKKSARAALAKITKD